MPDHPHRKDIRWKPFDYTLPCNYFVTIDIHDKLHLLGTVENGQCQLNAAGQMVYDALREMPQRFEGTEILNAIVMPNRIHMLILNRGGYCLADMMRWFKSVTTNRYIKGVKEQGWTPLRNTFWQRNYFDRVIRDQQEFYNIVQYIEENPLRWEAHRRGVPPCTPTSHVACAWEASNEKDTQDVTFKGRTRGYAPTVVMLFLLLCGCTNAQSRSDVLPCAPLVGIEGVHEGTGAEGVHGGTPLRTGAEVVVDYVATGWLDGKQVAVVGNQTSIVGNTHMVDTLLASGVRVTKIFCPEHGFRGTAAAGAHVDNSTDPKTGLPIISLYGNNKKPTPEQLADVDVVLFDLQDVGCRFYTYLSTLHYVMEACAENNKPLFVLDRPNPNGHYVDGPVLDTATCRSFVGMHPVPVVYGMTIGEYAQMINGEGWLQGGEKCNLTVVPMQGYKRESVGYQLPVPPSPNLRTAHAVALYPSLCLFEGTHCGVGRGTDWPFEWVTYDTDTLDLRSESAPTTFSLKYLMEMYRRVPKGQFFIKNNFFDRLAGTTDLRRQMEQGMSPEAIRATWQPGLEHFATVRQRYLIYR